MTRNSNRFNSKWAGVMTALITPFKENEEIDFESMFALIDRQISAGINALVLCGSTGEAMSLSDQEYETLLSKSIKHINGRIKTIVGLSSNNLLTCIKRGNLAKSLGADALLAVTPYYYRSTQKGLIEFFIQLALSVDMPIILYNVPSRTSVDITSKTISQLSKVANIVAIKDASGNLSRLKELENELGKQELSATQGAEPFRVISGEDKIFVESCMLGASGTISVISNLYPRKWIEIYELCKDGQHERAAILQAELYEIIDTIFSVPNPIGIKCALASIGLCSNKLRLPLQKADLESEAQIVAAIKAIGEDSGRK